MWRVASTSDRDQAQAALRRREAESLATVPTREVPSLHNLLVKQPDRRQHYSVYLTHIILSMFN